MTDRGSDRDATGRFRVLLEESADRLVEDLDCAFHVAGGVTLLRFLFEPGFLFRGNRVGPALRL